MADITTNNQAETDKVQQNGIRSHMPMLRVVSITLHGTTLNIPANQLQEYMGEMDSSTGQVEGDESDTYKIKFKTMLQRDFDALGEFDGF